MIMFDKKGNERFRKTGFAAGDESQIITQAEEIMYGKKKREALEAAREKEAQERTERAAQEKAETTSQQAAPEVRKTTGCASTG